MFQMNIREKGSPYSVLVSSNKMEASFRSIASWIMASLLIFASLQRSEAITFTRQPAKPYVIVVGVNNTDSVLDWEFTLDAGETVISVLFRRNEPGGSNLVNLASRLPNSAFIIFEPYRNDYVAALNNRLTIKRVTNDQEYEYSILINYNENGVHKTESDKVHVVVKVPPRITVVPQRQSLVNIGTNLTLTCNASGDPQPRILWTKEGVEAKGYNVSGYRLHLVGVDRADVGSYKCTASNGYGSATSLAVVSVKCPNNTCQTAKTVGIIINDEQWPWKPAYNNSHSIEYKMLQSYLTSAIASVYTKNPGKQLYEQTITELRSGSIVVHLQLLFGSGVNDPLQPLRDEVANGKLGPFDVMKELVVVPKAITFTREPEKPYVVVVGVNNTNTLLVWEYVLKLGEAVQSISFERRKSDVIDTPVTLASRLGNTSFTVFEPYRKDYDAKLPSMLQIKRVTNDQEYIYSIVLNNTKNNVVQSPKRDEVHVIVKVPPRITVVPQGHSVVNIGTNFTLTCNASGDPQPRILWTKEGVEAKSYNVSGYRLNLVEVKRTDVGSYKCTASNAYGTATSLAVVNVKCPNNGCQTKTVGITIDDQQWPWKSAYNNSDSIEYKMLQSYLSSAIASVYTKNPGKQLYEQAITELRSGSIVAYVQLLFGSGVNDPLHPLRDEVAKGKLGPFYVIKELVVDPTFPPRSTLTDETTTGTRATPNNTGADNNSGLSTAEVSGIAIGVLLVIVVALSV